MKGNARQLVKCPSCGLKYNLNNKKQFGWYRIYMIPCKNHVRLIVECRKCHYELEHNMSYDDFRKFIRYK